MRIALAQINPIVGDIEFNLAKILEYIAKAKAKGADLVVFPESCIVGYPARDLLERKQLIDENLQALDKLKEHSDDIGIIVGYVEKNPLSKGKRLYNAAAFLYQGRIIHKQYKSLLPNYDVFDERRYFEPAQCVHNVEFKGKNVGITICEDLWVYNPALSKSYQYDPNKVLKELGADIIINISASPYSYEKPSLRIEMIKYAAIKNDVCYLYANQVGGNDELIFDGKSLVVNRRGQIKALANNFEEDLIFYDTEKDTGDIHTPSENELECIYKALRLGIKDYVDKCGFKKVILGLSGGIDSALTVALAVKALGKENVIGVSLPGPYSSQGSLDDAKDIAERLGIQYEIYSINDMFKATLSTVQPGDTMPLMDLAEENLQARLRANIIMTLSNRYGYLVLTTGNKSELSVGYSTLYGDMCGGLAVISDLYKSQVYDLCRFINEVEGEVIPPSSITKPPSAELRPDQCDQDSLPSYDLLDAILKDFIEENHTYAELLEKYDENTVKFVINKLDRCEYKRRQAPPGLKISSKAFGLGRRLPIAQNFKNR